MERTYVMVKPDGVQRGLVGEILKRFEQRGYQLLALELIHPTKERLEEHVSCTKNDILSSFCSFLLFLYI